MDGQWDDAIIFIEPIAKEFDHFDHKLFQKHILKHKYFELLCIKVWITFTSLFCIHVLFFSRIYSNMILL